MTKAVEIILIWSYIRFVFLGSGRPVPDDVGLGHGTHDETAPILTKVSRQRCGVRTTAPNAILDLENDV